MTSASVEWLVYEGGNQCGSENPRHYEADLATNGINTVNVTDVEYYYNFLVYHLTHCKSV